MNSYAKNLMHLKFSFDRAVTLMFLDFISLKIKNRIGVMRHVVLHGCLWDDLYIGFQNRISRDPDIYHHKYTHFFSHIYKNVRVQLKKSREQYQTFATDHSRRDLYYLCAELICYEM